MLIELEELKHKINNSKYYGTDAWRDILDMAADCDSKSRPQGEWINRGFVCQCTRCKGYSRGLLEEKNGKLCEPQKLIYPRFCPNCGAKMKGADNANR